MEMGSENEAELTTANTTWTFWDVAGILGLFLIGIFFTAFTMFFFGAKDLLSKRLVLFVGGLLGILVPLWWLNIRYGLFVEAVGLRKGRPNSWIYTLVALLAVIAINIVLWEIVPTRPGPPIQPTKTVTFLDFVFLPISILGFLMVVWGPISEEVLFRGLLYAYLRTRIGVPAGLLVQGLLFAFIHFTFFNADFYDGMLAAFQILIVGVLFGFLYERTYSIYPSIICHGAFNYLHMVGLYFWATR